MPRTATKKSTSAAKGAKGAKGASAAIPAATTAQAGAPAAQTVAIRGAVRTLKNITDETRVSVLMALHDGDRYVGDLAKHLGISQPSLSHHLAKLKDTGAVESTRDGKAILYTLTPTGQQMVGVVQRLMT